MEEIDMPSTKTGDTEYVFLAVYGTLRRGMSRHNIIKTCADTTFIHKVPVPGFSLLDLGEYPTVIRARNPQNPVICEVYKIPKHLLKIIDAIEGYPNLYNRMTIGEADNIYIYYMDITDAVSNKMRKVEWIRSGDYVEYIDKKNKTDNNEPIEEESA